MGSLGMVVAWSGYLLLVFGYSRVKSAYTGNGLSIADLALPSHRPAYMTAMKGYASSNPEAAAVGQKETAAQTAGTSTAAKPGAGGINQYGGTAAATPGGVYVPGVSEGPPAPGQPGF